MLIHMAPSMPLTHMECDQPTPPIQVVDSPSSHDSLDFELPLENTILEVMASTYKAREDENHRESILPSLEPTRVSMMSFNLGLGEFIETSSETPSIDPFPPRISFSELATKFSATPSIEDSCFVLPYVLMDPIKEIP
jgi:hypothetical protein